MVLLIIIILSVISPNQQPAKALTANKISESSRIVGGKVTHIGEAKFVVYLQKYEEYFCGGALVTPKFVITAAHCMENKRAEEITVTGGATYLTDRGIQSRVLEIFVPRGYNPVSVDMDIAVLELSRELLGANITTIKLCTTKWKPGDMITVYGWGHLSEYGYNYSNQLRVVSVPTVDRNKCRHMYKYYSKITSSMFCAGDLSGKDSCEGDSGGPAVLNDQLCGVVSFGLGCARREFPGVYADVMVFRDFINKIIN